MAERCVLPVRCSIAMLVLLATLMAPTSSVQRWQWLLAQAGWCARDQHTDWEGLPRVCGYVLRCCCGVAAHSLANIVPWIGCGINVSNSKPTVSINSIIEAWNSDHPAAPPLRPLSPELVCGLYDQRIVVGTDALSGTCPRFDAQ